MDLSCSFAARNPLSFAVALLVSATQVSSAFLEQAVSLAAAQSRLGDISSVFFLLQGPPTLLALSSAADDDGS